MMKLAILFFVTIGIVTSSAAVNAQTLGLNVIPPSANTGDREAVVISYSELEDSEVALFEAVLPATTEAGCLASNAFTSLVPIPADRTHQTFGQGKKVVIVFTKSSHYGACHVIVGRSGTTLSDFNTVRANFGSTRLFEIPNEKAEDRDANSTAQMSPKFHLIRHTRAAPGLVP